jgi:MFS family permease
MSGFWLMFMQLFDMLPNFIVDWVDTSALVAQFHLPTWMTNPTPRGTMIAQEWMINANSGLIVLLVVFISWLVSRIPRLTSILMGMIVSAVGLVLAGFTMSGVFCILGILCFSMGEMLSSPKMNEYLGVIAPEGQKALYMGYANIPLAIGWGYGSLLGGSVYDRMGDKANLALRYLAEHFHLEKGLSQQAILERLQQCGVEPARITQALSEAFAQGEGIARTHATAFLQAVTGKDAAQVTSLLWHTYHPFELWYQFAAIGLVSAVGIAVYARFARRWQARDI